MSRLLDKAAIVTGGTRGIGLGIVRAFLAEGARVLFCGRNSSTVDVAMAELGSPKECIGIVADLSHTRATADIVNAAKDAFGKIDVLVNNAGVVSQANVWELTPDEWDRIHDVNLRATFFVARDVAAVMRQHRSGSIINISSIAGQNGGLAGSPAYASSKAGVLGLTRALARRLAPDGIRVNCISPANIETDITTGWPQSLKDQLNALTPLARFGTVDEVTGATVFLASDEASFITGQTLNINGGGYLP